MNQLSDIWFANMFSHCIGCLFTLLIVSFAVQKLFSCSPICLILLFLPVFLVSYPLDTFPRPMSKSFSPALFSRSFTVSGLTFRSLICFELIFVCGIRIQFYSFACGCPVSQTPFVKETILSHCVFLESLSKIS